MGTIMLKVFIAAALVAVGQASLLPPAVTGADFNDTMCGACLMTMSNLDTVLDTKETADQVKAFALGVCTHLPEAHKANCAATANAEAVRISKCMVQKANFPSYCHAVGLCGSPRSSKAANQAGVCSWWNTKESKLNGRGCSYIVEGMKLQLNTTSMRTSMLSALEMTVCPQLPMAKLKCNAVVKDYGAQIMNMVMSTFNSDLFCCDIGYSSGIIVSEEDYQKFTKWTQSVEQPWAAHVRELNGMFGFASQAGSGTAENPLGMSTPGAGDSVTVQGSA